MAVLKKSCRGWPSRGELLSCERPDKLTLSKSQAVLRLQRSGRQCLTVLVSGSSVYPGHSLQGDVRSQIRRRTCHDWEQQSDPVATKVLQIVFGAILISQQNLVEARRVIKRSKALSACSPEQLPVTQDASFSRPDNFLNKTL
ncbi:hypothetical protein WJX82_002563 [Trebouxia sp. C0006]